MQISLNYLVSTILIMLAVSILSGGCTEKSVNPEDNLSVTDSIPAPAGWELVWYDEFIGNALDLTKWEYEVNANGGGNNELQYYTDRPENLWVSDGFLTIQALKETYTGSGGTRNYTSARIRTANKGDWKYGRFEIKAKLPYGQGIWPAIWMLPTDWIYGGWAASGEIDIMELIGHEPNRVYATLHYGGTPPNNRHAGSSISLDSGNFAMDFHVFTLEWHESRMDWYVDGALYYTAMEWNTNGYDFPAPFDQRFHLLLNVAVGGNWPGNPDNTTVFPQHMVVDYVRVFKEK